ncbi:hypothetical protein FRB97_001819, partial [Tulasnella sp. 331]
MAASFSLSSAAGEIMTEPCQLNMANREYEPLYGDDADSRRAEYGQGRRRLRERDLQLHLVLMLLSATALALWIAWVGWYYPPLIISNMMDILYSAVYLYTRARSGYVPGTSATPLVAFWVILVAYGLHIYPFFGPPPPGLGVVTMTFQWLSFASLVLIGWAHVSRHKLDSRDIARYRRPQGPLGLKVHTCDVEDLQGSGKPTGLPEHPSEYIMTHVGWWQERGLWKHHYVVVKAIPQQGSGARYFRVERHKTKWLAIWKPNILNYVTHSETFQDLTRDSILVTDFYVTDTEYARRSGYNIQSLGSLVEGINREAPIYALV